MKTGSRKNLAPLAPLALVLAVFAVYYTALGYGFVYDDSELILSNRWITSFSNMTEAFSTHTFGFKDEGYQAISYRPMIFVIYMAEYAVFGFSAWGWHLVNILMHSVNSVLVFLILKHLVDSEGKGYSSTMPAFAGSLIFAVHPTNAESVSWLATMAELTFTFLCLAAFYLEARSVGGKTRLSAERAVSRTVPALLFLAALLLKETAIVLPLIVLAYDVARKGFPGLFSGARVSRYLPYAVGTALYGIMRVLALKGELTPGRTLHEFLSTYEFVLNAIWLFARYLKALILPAGEPPLQLMDPVLSLADPRAYISIFAVAAVFLVFSLAFRRITRLWALVFVVVVLPILPTLYSPAISRFPYADRYLYFSTSGLAMLAGLILAWSRKDSRRWGNLALAAVLGAALPFAALAREKSAAWESDLTLWEAALAAQPGNYVAIHSIAAERLKQGRLAESISSLESALNMNLARPHPDESMVILTRQALIKAYLKAGLTGKAETGIEAYLKIMPEDAPYLYNLALIKQGKGLCGDALELYGRAALFSREGELSRMVFFNMGECYLALGKMEEALGSYREALRYAPGDAMVLGRIGAVSGQGAPK
jgi:tetratricopeptide (TPR) repeat protein